MEEEQEFLPRMEEQEHQELELLDWEAADAYRRMLYAKLNGLVAEGIFTTSEARAWEEGAEACEGNASWVQELLDKLGEYEDSGEAVWDEIEELLKSSFFAKTEATAWLSYAAKASYQEKLSLVGLLTIETKKRKKAQEEVAKAKYASIEDLVTMIQTAIGNGKLDEASALLLKLDPAEYQVSYVKLNKDLDKAKIRQTQETIQSIVVAA